MTYQDQKIILEDVSITIKKLTVVVDVLDKKLAALIQKVPKTHDK